jgi:hypothetical protein
MDAIKLPSCQANQSIPAFPLSRFENIERSEKPNEAKFKWVQEFAVFLRFAASQHHVVDDQVIALACHGGDGMAHPRIVRSMTGPVLITTCGPLNPRSLPSLRASAAASS